MSRQYTIIKNSESQTGYDIPDKEYKGVIDGLCCGWQFEFKNAEGKLNYNSVTWYAGTPEQYCDTWLRYGEDALFETERWNGYLPTGRVIFRGYGEEFWDAYERDYYIKDVEV